MWQNYVIVLFIKALDMQWRVTERPQTHQSWSGWMMLWQCLWRRRRRTLCCTLRIRRHSMLQVNDYKLFCLLCFLHTNSIHSNNWVRIGFIVVHVTSPVRGCWVEEAEGDRGKPTQYVVLGWPRYSQVLTHRSALKKKIFVRWSSKGVHFFFMRLKNQSLIYDSFFSLCPQE